jgi:type I restriction enzyme S subunit
VNEWKKGKLRELIEVNPQVKLTKGETYPFVGMDIVTPFYKPVEAAERREYKSGGSKFNNGDTLFARITPCLENGKTAKVKNLIGGAGFGSTEFFVLRGKKDITDNEFVYYLSTSENFRKRAEQLMTGTSGRQRVDREQFENQKITFPGIVEQRKISSILKNLDDKIEINLKINQTLEEMAMTLYKHWFVDFGPFQDGEFVESELGMIPKGWEPKKLGDLYNFAAGGTPSRKQNDYYESGTVKWVKSKELRDSFIVDTEEKITEVGLEQSSAKLFEKGTVLIAMYGATVGRLGILADSSATNQACCSLNTKGTLSNSIAYLYLKYQRDWIIRLAVGGAQQNINQKTVKDLKISIPKRLNTELKKVIEKIDTIFEMIKENTSEITYLKNIRDYLLPKLLSGEVDLWEAKKQIEETL